MSDLALARYSAVPNNGDELLHLELSTPAGPRRRCHPHFAGGGNFATGAADLLIKLTDPQLRGPAAHWEGICLECRKSIGIDDLLRARRERLDAEICRHGTPLEDKCRLCDREAFAEVGLTDVPFEGWEVLPFGGSATVIEPGAVLELCAHSQRMMRGPYRLRLHAEGAADRHHPELYIQGIKIGQNVLACAWGEIWGWSFEDSDPAQPLFDRLQPLAGPCIQLGQTATITLRNAEPNRLRVSAVLLGHGMREERDFRNGAPSVPRRRAKAVPLSAGERAGAPAQLPGNLSVPLPAWSKHALGIDDLDARFALDGGDVDFDRSEAFEYVEDEKQRRLLAAARAKNMQSMSHVPRLPPSGPVIASSSWGAPVERNPLEVLLDLGDELLQLQLQRHRSIVYEAKEPEGRCILRAAQLMREIERFWTPGADGKVPTPELFVPPRFTVAGVEFEVRRYEPPPPPPPPELPEAQRRYFEGRERDNLATTAHLIHKAILDTEDDECAWATATDES